MLEALGAMQSRMLGAVHGVCMALSSSSPQTSQITFKDPCRTCPLSLRSSATTTSLLFMGHSAPWLALHARLPARHYSDLPNGLQPVLQSTGVHIREQGCTCSTTPWGRQGGGHPRRRHLRRRRRRRWMRLQRPQGQPGAPGRPGRALQAWPRRLGTAPAPGAPCTRPRRACQRLVQMRPWQREWCFTNR